MPRNKRLHFKDVNTLRFFAFIPIFIYCVLYLTITEEEGIHNELTSVFNLLSRNSLDFFFFISAFLITSQALREYKYTDKFILKNYIIRRILRIVPLFLIGILFAFVGHPWILNMLKLNEIIPPSGSSYWLLFPNYFSEFTKEQYIYIAIIWTIYMLMQFYIFWGIILKAFRQKIELICYTLVGIGITARIIHSMMNLGYEFDTLCYGIPIGIGGLIAIKIRNESKIIEKIKGFSKVKNIYIYITGILLTLFGYILIGNNLLSFAVPVLTSIFLGYVIIEQTFSKNSFIKLRTFKIMSHLGKISYGLIFYQAMINVLLVIAVNSLDFDISTTSVKISFLLLSFVSTWIVANISFNIFEKPLLRFRREFKKI